VIAPQLSVKSAELVFQQNLTQIERGPLKNFFIHLQFCMQSKTIQRYIIEKGGFFYLASARSHF
jgi:hypothetical protein